MVSYEIFSGVHCLLRKEKTMVIIRVDDTPILLQVSQDNAVRVFSNADVQEFPLDE